MRVAEVCERLWLVKKVGAEITQKFFQTVQNKLHWAAHGHTATEIIYQRSDAQLPFMGLTSFKGKKL